MVKVINNNSSISNQEYPFEIVKDYRQSFVKERKKFLRGLNQERKMQIKQNFIAERERELERKSQQKQLLCNLEEE